MWGYGYSGYEGYEGYEGYSSAGSYARPGSGYDSSSGHYQQSAYYGASPWAGYYQDYQQGSPSYDSYYHNSGNASGTQLTRHEWNKQVHEASRALLARQRQELTWAQEELAAQLARRKRMLVDRPADERVPGARTPDAPEPPAEPLAPRAELLAEPANAPPVPEGMSMEVVLAAAIGPAAMSNSLPKALRKHASDGMCPAPPEPPPPPAEEHRGHRAVANGVWPPGYAGHWQQGRLDTPAGHPAPESRPPYAPFPPLQSQSNPAATQQADSLGATPPAHPTHPSRPTLYSTLLQSAQTTGKWQTFLQLQKAVTRPQVPPQMHSTEAQPAPQQTATPAQPPRQGTLLTELLKAFDANRLLAHNKAPPEQDCPMLSAGLQHTASPPAQPQSPLLPGPIHLWQPVPNAAAGSFSLDRDAQLSREGQAGAAERVAAGPAHSVEGLSSIVASTASQEKVDARTPLSTFRGQQHQVATAPMDSVPDATRDRLENRRQMERDRDWRRQEQQRRELAEHLAERRRSSQAPTGAPAHPGKPPVPPGEAAPPQRKQTHSRAANDATRTDNEATPFTGAIGGSHVLPPRGTSLLPPPQTPTAAANGGSNRARGALIPPDWSGVRQHVASEYPRGYDPSPIYQSATAVAQQQYAPLPGAPQFRPAVTVPLTYQSPMAVATAAAVAQTAVPVAEKPYESHQIGSSNGRVARPAVLGERLSEWEAFARGHRVALPGRRMSEIGMAGPGAQPSSTTMLPTTTQALPPKTTSDSCALLDLHLKIPRSLRVEPGSVSHQRAPGASSAPMRTDLSGGPVQDVHRPESIRSLPFRLAFGAHGASAMVRVAPGSWRVVPSDQQCHNPPDTSKLKALAAAALDLWGVGSGRGDGPTTAAAAAADGGETLSSSDVGAASNGAPLRVVVLKLRNPPEARSRPTKRSAAFWGKSQQLSGAPADQLPPGPATPLVDQPKRPVEPSGLLASADDSETLHEHAKRQRLDPILVGQPQDASDRRLTLRVASDDAAAAAGAANEATPQTHGGHAAMCGESLAGLAEGRSEWLRELSGASTERLRSHPAMARHMINLQAASSSGGGGGGGGRCSTGDAGAQTGLHHQAYSSASAYAAELTHCEAIQRAELEQPTRKQHSRIAHGARQQKVWHKYCMSEQEQKWKLLACEDTRPLISFDAAANAAAWTGACAIGPNDPPTAQQAPPPIEAPPHPVSMGGFRGAHDPSPDARRERTPMEALDREIGAILAKLDTDYATKTMLTMVKNIVNSIVKNLGELRYRWLSTDPRTLSNRSFRESVLAVSGGPELLFAIGFVPQGDALVLPMEVDPAKLMQCCMSIDAALTLCTAQETPRKSVRRWTESEEDRLREIVMECSCANRLSWAVIATRLATGRTALSAQQHWDLMRGKRVRKNDSEGLQQRMRLHALKSAAAIVAREARQKETQEARQEETMFGLGGEEGEKREEGWVVESAKEEQEQKQVEVMDGNRVELDATPDALELTDSGTIGDERLRETLQLDGTRHASPMALRDDEPCDELDLGVEEGETTRGAKTGEGAKAAQEWAEAAADEVWACGVPHPATDVASASEALTAASTAAAAAIDADGKPRKSLDEPLRGGGEPRRREEDALVEAAADGAEQMEKQEEAARVQMEIG